MLSIFFPASISYLVFYKNYNNNKAFIALSKNYIFSVIYTNLFLNRNISNNFYYFLYSSINSINLLQFSFIKFNFINSTVDFFLNFIDSSVFFTFMKYTVIKLHFRFVKTFFFNFTFFKFNIYNSLFKICSPFFYFLNKTLIHYYNKNMKHTSIYLYINNKQVLLSKFLKLLHSSFLFSFKILYDICVIDYPANRKRFELLYCLVNISQNIRLFLKTFITENMSIDSVSTIFQSANWLEREAWDLFGIYFNKHANLRRILTDYGFKGFPFRKDFPLSGFIEVRYDDERSAIVYEPVEITQEFRIFNFKSPWENYSI